MTPLVRSFFAVDIGAEARAALAAETERLSRAVPEGAKWVPPENLHLTLKFLGELPPDQFPRLLRRTAAKLVGTPPFCVELAGFGAFPNARETRVLWIGATTGQRELTKLARRIDQAAKVVGVSREKRPFEAHLTLGRLRPPQRVPLDRIDSPKAIAFPVEEVVLYRSDLSSEGARYSPIATLSLHDGEPEGPDVFDFAPET